MIKTPVFVGFYKLCIKLTCFRRTTMKKFCGFIVKSRFVFMPIFIVLIVVCVILSQQVEVNYDILDYLAPESDSVIATDKLTEEFGSLGSAQILIGDISIEEAQSLYSAIENVDGVNSVIFDATSDTNYKDGTALFTIYLDTSDFDFESYAVIDEIEQLLEGYSVALGGSTVTSEFLTLAMDEDMPIILGIATAIVFVVLLLTCSSWIEPFIFLFIIFGAILINMGTNIIFAQISYLTSSIAAVLQLALAMDYSIVLLHNYRKEQKRTLLNGNNNLSNSETMTNALFNSFKPISSSGLTTMAGLLALVFMSFTIGFDVGMVLAKGILVSLVSVLIFMPGYLLLFDKLIKKTAHRSIFDLFIKEKPCETPTFNNYSYSTSGSKVAAKPPVTCYSFHKETQKQIALYKSNHETNTTNDNINANKKIEKTDNKQNSTINYGNYNNSYVQTAPSGYGKFVNKTRFLFPLILVLLIAVGAVFNSSLTYYYAAETSSDPNATISVDTQLISDTFGEQNILVIIIPSDDQDSEYNLINALNNYEDASGDNAISNVTAFATTGLYDYYDCTALSLAFGIDESLINPIFTALETDSAQLYDILMYLDESDYLNTTFTALESEIDTMYTSLSSLNIPLTSSQMATSLGVSETMTAALFTQLGGEETYTTCYAATYISTYNVISTMYDGIQNEIDSAYSIIDYVPNVDDPLTLEQASTEYYYLPSETLETIYGQSSTKTSREIITFLSLYQVVSAVGEEIEASCDEIAYYFAPLNKATMAAIFPIPDDYFTIIYGESETKSIYETVDFICTYDVISSLNEAYSAIASEIIDSAVAADSMFNSDNYTRLLVTLSYASSSEDNYETVNDIRELTSLYYDESYICGAAATYTDIDEYFSVDIIIVNLISFFAIFLIIALTFRSLLVPIILSLLIQGAIWVTMAINVFMGSGIFFLCYIICLCIQTGATIDYAILLTSKYLEFRKSQSKLVAISSAMRESLPTILTSGSILVLATLIVGSISNIALISLIGYLLMRGSIISLSFIALLLPQVLVLLDKPIAKTTFKSNFLLS